MCAEEEGENKTRKHHLISWLIFISMIQNTHNYTPSTITKSYWICAVKGKKSQALTCETQLKSQGIHFKFLKYLL